MRCPRLRLQRHQPRGGALLARRHAHGVEARARKHRPLPQPSTTAFAPSKPNQFAPRKRIGLPSMKILLFAAVKAGRPGCEPKAGIAAARRTAVRGGDFEQQAARRNGFTPTARTRRPPSAAATESPAATTAVDAGAPARRRRPDGRAVPISVRPLARIPRHAILRRDAAERGVGAHGRALRRGPPRELPQRRRPRAQSLRAGRARVQRDGLGGAEALPPGVQCVDDGERHLPPSA